jgi:hypothetical protein
MEQKAFLKSFVKGLEVGDFELRVNYTLLMPSLNADKETVRVLASMQNGGPSWTVPELLFEKKQLIPALQQLLPSSPRAAP